MGVADTKGVSVGVHNSLIWWQSPVASDSGVRSRTDRASEAPPVSHLVDKGSCS